MIAPDVPAGMLRALTVESKVPSLPFSVTRPRDRLVLLFGGGGSG